MTLRLGLLGCGRIAQIAHLPALQALPDVAVVALSDRTPAQLDAAGQWAPDAARYTNYRTLLNEAAVDAVLICLPSALHAEAAVAAFEAGVHVYVEKPVATSLADARAVRAAQARAGTVGMVGFNFRFGAEAQRARTLLREGRLGPLAYAHSTFTAAPRRLADWKTTRDGGALLNLGSHHLDLLPHLLGAPVETVAATIQSRHTEHDTAAVQLRLAGGLTTQSFFSMSAAATDHIEVFGEAGRLSLDRFGKQLAVEGPEIEYSRPKRLFREVRTFADGLRSIRRPVGEPSFQTALAAFLSSIRTGRPEGPTLADGLRSLAVVEAAEQAAATGRVVPVAPIDAPDHIPSSPAAVSP